MPAPASADCRSPALRASRFVNAGAQASQALATGTATDISAATVAVEKAAIALQLTAAFRNKAVEAYQDVMRMQI